MVAVAGCCGGEVVLWGGEVIAIVDGGGDGIGAVRVRGGCGAVHLIALADGCHNSTRRSAADRPCRFWILETSQRMGAEMFPISNP